MLGLTKILIASFVVSAPATAGSVCGSCVAGAAGVGPGPYNFSLFCTTPGDSIATIDFISWGDDITGMCGTVPNATDPCDNKGNATALRALLTAACVGKDLCVVDVSTNTLGTPCAKGQKTSNTALTVQATCAAGPAASQCGHYLDPGLQFAGVFTDNAVLQRAPAAASL